jgi:uncharacterized membrane protein
MLQTRKAFLYLSLIFLAFTIFCALANKWLATYNINAGVVFFANLLMACLTAASLYIHVKALQNKNPNVFIRSVTATSMMKLIIIAATVFIYLALAGEKRNIYGVIAGMGVYVIYTVFELVQLFQFNKMVHEKS